MTTIREATRLYHCAFRTFTHVLSLCILLLCCLNLRIPLAHAVLLQHGDAALGTAFLIDIIHHRDIPPVCESLSYVPYCTHLHRATAKSFAAANPTTGIDLSNGYGSAVVSDAVLVDCLVIAERYRQP